ncbi:AAA family ATPase [Arcanobacterium haemolyticum]|nr:AAA family ATPase [Arcanobacterium haemolyticum]
MSETEPSQPRTRALAEEQVFVDEAYAALDRQRTAYETRLKNVRAQTGQESAGEMSERDSFATHYEDNLIRLRNVENRLVLGRLDMADGTVDHIGRIGLKNDEHDVILLDWRAPQAVPFYQATAANPGNVVRRRHIQTRLRSVTSIEDELLDSSASLSDLNLTGEGALMAAMNEARDGKMTDIVATIQAEQDRIIRADSHGVLVVQGGPGTGKTAVALHRCAYLLYSERERLRRSGVLVIGPSPVFLRYIDQVLPALGESDVVSTTIDSLLPGVTPTRDESPEVREIKGRLVWRIIAKRAVRRILQKQLPHPVTLRISGVSVKLLPRDVDEAQRRARTRGKKHNQARDTYARALVDLLAQRVAAAKDIPLSENEWIIGDVAGSVDARREINLRWLPSSPAQLLERLYARPELLALVAPELSENERTLLVRPKGSGFSSSDIAILDELAEHLGAFHDDFERRQSQAAAARDAELSAYVKDTMSSLGLGGGIVDAHTLTERFTDSGPATTLAEKASADRSWTYGHVVVDEAQELSPMQWEMLIRRCPTRSFTIVGDVDQRPAGAPRDGWKPLLGRLAENMREETLTVSYRTPGSILDAAGRAVASAGIHVAPVTPARDLPGALITDDINAFPASSDRWEHALTSVVTAHCTAMDDEYGAGGGTLAIITPQAHRDAIARIIRESPLSTTWSVETTGTNVSARIQVRSAYESKGLEYDVVVLVDPATILSEGPGNLYVAMTRPTKYLHVLHDGPLPAALRTALEE